MNWWDDSSLRKSAVKRIGVAVLKRLVLAMSLQILIAGFVLANSRFFRHSGAGYAFLALVYLWPLYLIVLFRARISGLVRL